MTQCTLTFAVCTQTYAGDKEKVLFILALLRGDALKWAREIATDEKHPLRTNYTAFKKELDNLYLDRNLKYAAEDKLMRLYQTKSAAAYAVEFQSLVALLDLNDAAKCLLFYWHLKPDVKDSIVTVGRETTFPSLVDQAVNIDQRKYQRTLEERKSTPSSSSSRPVAPSTGRSDPRQSTPTPPTSSRGPRGPLSTDEKERRRVNNLCHYCGDPGHIGTACPARPNRPSISLAESRFAEK